MTKPLAKPELPPGWVYARIADVCVSVADGDHQPPPRAVNGVPFLVIGDVSKNGKLNFGDTRFVSQSYYDGLGDSRRPKLGDILYSVTGSFGIPVLVDTVRSFCVQRYLAILRPHSACNQRYLQQALSTRTVFSQAGAIATGTAQKTVPLKGLRNILVPLAPEGEQARIVEVLDSYLTRLDAAAEGLKRVQTNLKRYRASVLKAAVEGRLVPTEADVAKKEGRSYESAAALLGRILQERRGTWEAAEMAKMKAKGRHPNGGDLIAKYEDPGSPDPTTLPKLPDGWCWATVDQVSVFMQYGTSAKTSEHLDGVPVIRMGNIVGGYLAVDADSLKYLPRAHAEFPGLLLEVGDMLFNRTNSPELVGKSAVYEGNPNPCSFASYLIRVRCAAGVQPAFVAAFLNSPMGRAWVATVKNQQVGQANVNGSKLAACPIPLPPAPEQERIVAELERTRSYGDALQKSVERDRVRVARLLQCVLKWAFEGRLVDQDSKDEPASVLLDRIRQARTTAAAEVTVRKTA